MKSLFSSQINLDKLARVLWAGALLALPVTSFRFFPGLGETTYVRPLAFYPLALLLPILLIQFWRNKRHSPWSGSMTVLGAFLLVLLAATVISALNAPLELRGQSYWGRAMRAWATVTIGISFFIAAVWMNRDEDDLKYSVRWILAGFVLDIAWSGVQALAFYTPFLSKVTVTHWQLAFSMRELVKTNRISGLAYEPAWLAGQITTLYLPWLLAALLTKTHFTRYKWLEALLFGLGGLVLLATYSRGGLVTAFGAVGITFLSVGGETLRSSWRWFISGLRPNKRAKHWLPAIGLRFGLVLFVAVLLVGIIFFLGQKDYFADLWSSDAESLKDFIIDNSAGARAAYNSAGLATYADYPWLGVGLGASGFYLYDRLPDWSLTTLPEIVHHLDPSSHLYPNPKNIYLRVLAEGGLLSFSFFLAFLCGLLGDALSFLRKPGMSRFLGIAGLCSWLAIALYNLTQDSFATPNIWVNLGILAGMSRIHSARTLEEHT